MQFLKFLFSEFIKPCLFNSLLFIIIAWLYISFTDVLPLLGAENDLVYLSNLYELILISTVVNYSGDDKEFSFS